MEKQNLTPEQKEWCRNTMMRISKLIPKQYSLFLKARLKKQGLNVNLRYICDCKNLICYDTRVVKALEELTQDLTKGKK